MKFLLKPFVQLWKLFDHSLFRNFTLENKIALSFCLLPFAHSKNLNRGRAVKQPLNQHVHTSRFLTIRQCALKLLFKGQPWKIMCVISLNFLQVVSCWITAKSLENYIRKSSQGKGNIEERWKRRWKLQTKTCPMLHHEHETTKCMSVIQEKLSLSIFWMHWWTKTSPGDIQQQSQSLTVLSKKTEYL